ncbi:hypothetical protein [Hymenobacter terrestris]|uniref:Uncharacterized protein n=1 Tax=Hymenobacter terrestris TaxID=2748310 RepID=A0ABX2Q8T2_9BACT|nr:hypothetical protein [Hymenobacter terrestris]NVO86114.1 hypothetical protein [Hymenobacter terrestris]
MRYSIPTLPQICISSYPNLAQSTLEFTVQKSTQLVADAGTDKTIQPGNKVTLGGAKPSTGRRNAFVDDNTYQHRP